MQRSNAKSGHWTSRQAAFTLIELMVVVVVISILIGGIFKLLSAAGNANKRASTQATLEKLQNALSGFYAQYGTYPPVAQYGSPDPFGGNRQDDFGSDLVSEITGETDGPSIRTAIWAAKCQPVAFEFPPMQLMDDYVNKSSKGALGINGLMGQTADSISSDDWADVKMFKFGLLSYLLPRVETIGCPDSIKDVNKWNSGIYPQIGFYQSKQWKKANPASKVGSDKTALTKALLGQRRLENEACAHWLPNFKDLLYGGPTVLGVETATDSTKNEAVFRKGKDHNDYAGGTYYFARGNSGSQTALRLVTLLDAWDQEYFYYSPPPYQSYRVWSAGPDRRTFPPWIPLDNLTTSQRKIVATWIADDIVVGGEQH
jgi:prepilin-type N-terminal cleavage/methylation domain-containing protein